MKKKDILSLIIGLSISAVISGIVYYLLMIETLDFLGMESFVNPERRDAKIFYTVLILTISTIFAALILILVKRKNTAIGFSIPLLVGFWILLKVGLIYLNKSNYYEPFNKVKWIESPQKPVRMARQLIKSGELRGLTYNQALQKFGEMSPWKTRDTLYIGTNVYDGWFVLIIDDDKITDASLFLLD